ncbi:MAG: HD domain-containing protein [Planctomycetota bacterium]|nr:HD domain-containing protein [Planctomycetota bacterium]
MNTEVTFDMGALPSALLVASRRLALAGGRPFLVGGAVIDLLCGREPKDWDIEVFGVDVQQVEACFSDMHTDTVGAAFGVTKVTMPDGTDLDISVPRRDNKRGVGHRGFDIEVDPTMTVTEAARRRDFSINSMSIELSTGKLVDPFGGLADLSAGVLRATDPATFVEDPLRVFRAMQLLARKARSVSPHTMALMRGMRSEFDTLAPERIWEEFRKLLLKSDKPSVGLDFLVDVGWVACFPDLEAMRLCPQHPGWHPEGDVWTHACLAADAAADLRPHVDPAFRETLMFAAWLHDIGKPETTIMTEEQATLAGKPLWSAHGHDVAGVEPADSFLRQLTGDKGGVKLRAQVTTLVREHMQPFNLVHGGAGHGAWARLHRRLAEVDLDLTHLASVCRCDACATGDWRRRSLAGGAPNWEHRTSKACLNWAGTFSVVPPVPLVKGRDFLAAGVKPGPLVGKLCRLALEAQLDNPDRTKADLVHLALNATITETT